MEGKGVVNNDGKAAKYWLPYEFSKNDNLKIAKSSVSLRPAESYVSSNNEEDNVDKEYQFDRKSNPKSSGVHIHRDLKISPNALRNRMFNRTQPFQTSHMFTKDSELIPYQIANETSLLRGYLLTDASLKRKSPIMISDAIQYRGDLLKMEYASSSGPKTDTSLYMVDSVGEVGYKFEASIDIAELGFVSCDPIFDRPAFNADMFDEYRNVLGKNLDFDASSLEIKHYVKAHSEIPVAERGILLPPDTIKKLVITAISNILRIEFKKASGYARVTELSVLLAGENELFIDLEECDATSIDSQDALARFVEHELEDFEPYYAYREATDIEIEGNGVAMKLYQEFQAENEKKKKKKKASKKTTKKTSDNTESED